MQRVALVTGASSGIGAVFARRLARDGFGLILVARRQERLEQLARELGGAETIAADLTAEADLTRVEARIVSDAGTGTAGQQRGLRHQGQVLRDSARRPGAHAPAARHGDHAAHARGARRHGAARSGGVINVSSVAAFGQSPGNVSYCATKAWMNSFTDGLDLELKSAGSPVRVQALCPGFTVTEFHDAMGMSRDGIPGWMWMKADDVVDASLRGLQRGKVFVVPGAFYKLIVTLEKLVPRARSAAVVAPRDASGACKWAEPPGIAAAPLSTAPISQVQAGGKPAAAACARAEEVVRGGGNTPAARTPRRCVGAGIRKSVSGWALTRAASSAAECAVIRVAIGAPESSPIPAGARGIPARSAPDR